MEVLEVVEVEEVEGGTCEYICTGWPYLTQCEVSGGSGSGKTPGLSYSGQDDDQPGVLAESNLPQPILHQRERRDGQILKLS